MKDKSIKTKNIKVKWLNKYWMLAIAIFGVLSLSAGCSCSAKTYPVASNFNNNDMFISKLMIMNLEDGDNVYVGVKNKNLQYSAPQLSINHHLKSQEESDNLNHSNTQFFQNNESRLPFGTNLANPTCNDKSYNQLNSCWHNMFVRATSQTDPYYTKPYFNICFAHVIGIWDYRDKVTVNQNYFNKGSIKTPSTKLGEYDNMGHLAFGDWNKKEMFQNPFTQKDLQKGVTCGYKPDPTRPNRLALKYIYPIDIKIAINYKNPINSQSKIPLDSEMDVTMQFIINRNIFVTNSPKTHKTPTLTTKYKAPYKNLISNLKKNNENSPTRNPIYENILQFEDVTNIEFPNS